MPSVGQDALQRAPDSWHHQRGGFYFNQWFDVVNCQVKYFHRLFAAFGFDLLQSSINHALCDGFLPESITTFMNLANSTLPNFGSGKISRFGTSRRRGISIPFLSSVGTLSPSACQMTNHLHSRCFPVGHCVYAVFYFFLVRLAPYLERDCLRSLTPCRSSEPRTMW